MDVSVVMMEFVVYKEEKHYDSIQSEIQPVLSVL